MFFFFFLSATVCPLVTGALLRGVPSGHVQGRHPDVLHLSQRLLREPSVSQRALPGRCVLAYCTAFYGNLVYCTAFYGNETRDLPHFKNAAGAEHLAVLYV